MNLYDACEIGYSCGLESIGECIDNISIHAPNIFSYDYVNKELNELFEEVQDKGFKNHQSVKYILGQKRMDAIDKEIEEKVFGYKK